MLKRPDKLYNASALYLLMDGIHLIFERIYPVCVCVVAAVALP